MLLSLAHQQEVYGKVDDTSDIIRHVADMLCQGKSKEDVRAYLLTKGQDEGQAYLTYTAACLLATDRVMARSLPRVA